MQNSPAAATQLVAICRPTISHRGIVRSTPIDTLVSEQHRWGKNSGKLRDWIIASGAAACSRAFIFASQSTMCDAHYVNGFNVLLRTSVSSPAYNLQFYNVGIISCENAWTKMLLCLVGIIVSMALFGHCSRLVSRESTLREIAARGRISRGRRDRHSILLESEGALELAVINVDRRRGSRGAPGSPGRFVFVLRCVHSRARARLTFARHKFMQNNSTTTVHYGADGAGSKTLPEPRVPRSSSAQVRALRSSCSSNARAVARLLAGN